MAAAIRSAEAAEKNQEGRGGLNDIVIRNRLRTDVGQGEGWKGVHISLL